MIHIIQLPLSRWQEYKKLRLEALRKEPQAFSSTYHEQATQSDETWRKWLASKSCVRVFAQDSQTKKLVGMMAGYWVEQVKIRHIASIVNVYVKKSYRGQKIGSRLMETLIKKLKTHGIEKVKLTVDPNQLSAKALYGKQGFSIAGTLSKESKTGNRYSDEIIMEKFLS